MIQLSLDTATGIIAQEGENGDGSLIGATGCAGGLPSQDGDRRGRINRW